MDRPSRRVAVVAPNWLGDAVMSLDAVRALHVAGVHVHVLGAPYVARVYAGLDCVDTLSIDPRGGRVRRILARARSLDAGDADAVVVLPPSFSSAMGAVLGGVPIRVGFSGDSRRALLSHCLSADALRREHLTENYRRLVAAALAAVGVEMPAARRPPSPCVTDDDHAECEALLASLDSGVLEDRAFAVVVPGATFGPAKTWPRKRFRELVEMLAREVPVLVSGTQREATLCDQVAAGATGARSIAGRLSLGGFMALLSRAGVVVANDSGAAHLAAALGTRVVVLFGSTSPGWTRPLGPNVNVLQHVVHCNPCFRRDCPTQLECFNGIDVGDVLDAARSACDVARLARAGDAS